jgi:hypothetical protein
MAEPLRKGLFEENENTAKLMNLSDLQENLNVPAMKAYGRSRGVDWLEVIGQVHITASYPREIAPIAH